MGKQGKKIFDLHGQKNDPSLLYVALFSSVPPSTPLWLVSLSWTHEGLFELAAPFKGPQLASCIASDDDDQLTQTLTVRLLKKRLFSLFSQKEARAPLAPTTPLK